MCVSFVVMTKVTPESKPLSKGAAKSGEKVRKDRPKQKKFVVKPVDDASLADELACFVVHKMTGWRSNPTSRRYSNFKELQFHFK